MKALLIGLLLGIIIGVGDEPMKMAVFKENVWMSVGTGKSSAE